MLRVVDVDRPFEGSNVLGHNDTPPPVRVRVRTCARQVTTGELQANLTDMQSAADAKVLFDEVGTKVIAMIMA